MNSQNLIRNAVKLVLSVLIVLSFTFPATAQYFVKSYDFLGNTDVSYSIEKNPFQAGRWSIAGYTNSNYTAGLTDWMFIKINNAGNFTHTSLFGFSNNDTCYEHKPLMLTPGFHVLAGEFQMNPLFRTKASFLIVDSNGNAMFGRQIADSLQHCYRGVATNNIQANIHLAGYIENPTPTPFVYNHKILLSQYNGMTFVKNWAFKYLTMNNQSSERAYSVCLSNSDLTSVITGTTNYYKQNPAINDVFVSKFYSTGFPVWTKVYKLTPSYVDSESRKIISLYDGGFAVIGWTNLYDTSSSDIWVFRLDANGNLIWSKSYGSLNLEEKGYSIIQSIVDNNLVFTGMINTTSNQDEILCKISLADGSIIWAKNWDKYSVQDCGYDLEEANTPSGYAVTGYTTSQSSSIDAFLMRTNQLGNVTPGCVDSLMLPIMLPAPEVENMTLIPNVVNDIAVMPQTSHPFPLVKTLCVITGSGSNNNVVPEKFVLKQNFPNPFNPTTNIEYSLPYDCNVKIVVCDCLGRQVATLVNEHKTTGNYMISFNASELPSGIYFYQIQAGNFKDVKKLTLVR